MNHSFKQQRNKTMAKQINNTNEVINNEVDQLKIDTMALSDTSKKIRFLLSKDKKVAEVYKLLKDYGVTTKTGGEIRYQHVRNVAMTKLSNS